MKNSILSSARGAVLLACICFLAACSKNPEPKREEPGKEEHVNSIAFLRSLYNGYPRKIDAEIYLTGGIISSDRQGNIYKSIYVEDSTGGIEIKLDLTDIWRVYPRGKSVSVRCNSLTIGSYGGRLQLGAAGVGAWETSPIEKEQITSYLTLKDDSEKPINPHTLDISQLSQRYVGCWVRVNDVRFINEEQGLDWGEPDKDVDRHVTNLRNDTLSVRVLHLSELAQFSLPSGRGSIEGVLGYFNGRYQLVPLSNSDNSMY